MKTSVYIKMDAYDQLLLSEGVCRQLGIISYHSDVYPGKQKQRMTTRQTMLQAQIVLRMMEMEM